MSLYESVRIVWDVAHRQSVPYGTLRRLPFLAGREFSKVGELSFMLTL